MKSPPKPASKSPVKKPPKKRAAPKGGGALTDRLNARIVPAEAAVIKTRMADLTAAAKASKATGLGVMTRRAPVAAFLAAVMEASPFLRDLMLDDPAAELDVDNLGKLLAAVARIPAQLIITSVHESGLEGVKLGRKFHVKQGNFL